MVKSNIIASIMNPHWPSHPWLWYTEMVEFKYNLEKMPFSSPDTRQNGNSLISLQIFHTTGLQERILANKSVVKNYQIPHICDTMGLLCMQKDAF
ncbi:hypothetical protein PR048_028625 [Dryococelus australis]|uniref:Uncharacterized protein n=1 Tax=Dryococelus australis TaxID=614101 RepID=A0ABQ9GB34_9NEOP|nr:hypothetical protein PR048_028625 [Dryococelus australis]